MDAPADARDRLLRRVLEVAAAEGIAGRSLREIAASAGTSHRMLLYHFGSREGLLGAIVAAMEAGQRDVLAGLAASAPTPRALAEAHWVLLRDPAVLPSLRLFFEVFGLVVREAPGTEGLRETLTAPWLERAAALAEELGVERDDVATRLAVAVTRGLLLDLVAGGDPAAVDAAYRRFLDLVDA